MEMTKRERVLNALRGKPVDHVPVCVWQHVPPIYWEEEDFIREQVEFYCKSDVDFMKLSGDKFFYWPSPVLKDIQTASQLYEVQPIGPDHPYIREYVERTKKVVDAIHEHGDCCCFSLIFVPISYIRLTIGYSKMMQFIREDPQAMMHACRIVAEDTKHLIKGLLTEAGVDGIFYSVQNGELSRFTPEEYAAWLAPAELDLLAYANTLSENNLIHFCGWEGEPNQLDLWKDYKAAGVSWARYIENMDVQEAKEHFGCTVWGGFDNRKDTLLYTGTKEEIEAEVKRLVEVSGKQNFMIGPDCSLDGSLSMERIQWLVEAAHKL